MVLELIKLSMSSLVTQDWSRVAKIKVKFVN